MSSRTIALLVLTAGCADFERGDRSPEPPPGEDAGTTGDGVVATDGGAAAVSFARDIHPLLVDRCGRCHSSSGQASDTTLILGSDANRDLPPVRKLVNLDNPAASRLLIKAAGTGHGGGAILAATSAEYQAILQWISQGSAP
jgi:hypothetical protein